MSLSTLTGNLIVQFKGTAQNTISGSTDYNPIENTLAITKTLSFTSATANASAGGADFLYSAVTSIAGGGNTSLDLAGLSDILGGSATVARIKGILIRLLSTTDDSTNGTAATSITLGNGASNDWTSQSGSGWFENATDEFVIPNGGFLAFGTPAAAGVLVDATHDTLKILNNDGSVTAKVQVTVFGGDT